jgi:CRISPR-associated protein Cas2
MMVVTYDISSNRVRAQFSKFLSKFGRKLQYSVYEIRNSKRIRENIQKEIELNFKKKFQGCDSIIILAMCERCKSAVTRYGYACNDEKGVVVFE